MDLFFHFIASELFIDYKVVMLTRVHENAFNIHWYPLIKLKSIEVFCFYFQKKEKANV